MYNSCIEKKICLKKIGRNLYKFLRFSNKKYSLYKKFSKKKAKNFKVSKNLNRKFQICLMKSLLEFEIKAKISNLFNETIFRILNQIKNEKVVKIVNQIKNFESI